MLTPPASSPPAVAPRHRLGATAKLPNSAKTCCRKARPSSLRAVGRLTRQCSRTHAGRPSRARGSLHSPLPPQQRRRRTCKGPCTHLYWQRTPEVPASHKHLLPPLFPHPVDSGRSLLGLGRRSLRWWRGSASALGPSNSGSARRSRAPARRLKAAGQLQGGQPAGLGCRCLLPSGPHPLLQLLLPQSWRTDPWVRALGVPRLGPSHTPTRLAGWKMC